LAADPGEPRPAPPRPRFAAGIITVLGIVLALDFVALISIERHFLSPMIQAVATLATAATALLSAIAARIAIAESEAWVGSERARFDDEREAQHRNKNSKAALSALKGALSKAPSSKALSALEEAAKAAPEAGAQAAES